MRVPKEKLDKVGPGRAGYEVLQFRSKRTGIVRSLLHAVAGCLIFLLELAAATILVIAIGFFIRTGTSIFTAGAVRISGSGAQPNLAFACCEESTDSGGIAASSLLIPEVIAQLQRLHAGVAVALSDQSPARTQIVRQLNQAGIPATAWIVLPMDEGYYLTADNTREAFARFSDFEKWTDQNHLRWTAVGLDIEPSIQSFTALRRDSKRHLFFTAVKRYVDVNRVTRARTAYADLFKEIRARRYPVQTYQLPFIVSGREAHTTLVERLLGIVDVKPDLEAVMIYSSFNASIGSGMIWKLGPESQAITVGVAGDPTYTWQRFSSDLIVASHFTNTIGVYDLEGAIRQEFLPRLETMDWGDSVTIPTAAARRAIALHALLPSTLWTLAHLPYIAICLILANILLIRRRNFRRSLS